jgi:hypothetical protein
MVFEDEDELEEWLTGLDYDAFWKAIVCFPELDLEERAAFDALIIDGYGTEAEILESLKIIAQVTIAQAQDLLPRMAEPTGPSMRIH